MPSGSTGNTNVESFQTFLEGWLVRQEHYLDELVSAEQNCHESSDDDLRELVNRVLAHYQQYYEEKSRLAHRNIFLVFSPPWFSAFEQTFLWIAGFKPGLAFQVLNNSVNDLSEEQTCRITELLQETKMEEKILNSELAKIQESSAAPPLLELAKQRAQSMEGDLGGEEVTALETLKLAMESVVESADSLRTSTVVKLMEILNSVQNVKFMTAVAQLQLSIRCWGFQRYGGRR